MTKNSFIVLTQAGQLQLTALQPLKFEQWLACKHWFAGSAIQTAELSYGADLVELQLRFAGEFFTLHYEDYSESCWVSADSAGAAVLLSELATHIRLIEL